MSENSCMYMYVHVVDTYVFVISEGFIQAAYPGCHICRTCNASSNTKHLKSTQLLSNYQQVCVH